MVRVAGRSAPPPTPHDDNIAAPLPVSLLATLSEGIELDFATLREILQCADSPLSKSISHLHAAGYVTVRKASLGSRQRTWVRSSGAGREAVAGQLQAVREVGARGGGASV